MGEIAKTHHGGPPAVHHAHAAWARVMVRLRCELAERKLHAARAVVLVPYVQLIQQARRAWLASATPDAAAAGFLPRFESTLNWSRALGGFAPSGDDLRLDAGFDALTARALLQRAGLGEHVANLAPKVMEVAWSLAGPAAAQPPAQRSDWGAGLAQTLFSGMQGPLLAYEAAVARIALAWASTSCYATDGLFAANPELLVVVDGFQDEPVTDALAKRLGERCLRLSLDDLIAPPDSHGQLALHAALDFEDEAERTAACVLQQLALGRSPVALVAVDRQLTRRVRAMLGENGIMIRDETGWKLSTTRAAATLMGGLAACRWDASSDEVLDWLKNAPAFAASADAAHALILLEQELRKLGVRDWPRAGDVAPGRLSEFSPPVLQLMARSDDIRRAMQGARPLRQWLHDVRALLRASGQWTFFLSDGAGRATLAALGFQLGPDAATDGSAGQAVEAFRLDDFPLYATQFSPSAFKVWVSQTLEGATYSPAHPVGEQVVILPLAQLLGRPLPAVILAGCDEERLPVSPEPPGPWTPAQREALGLPLREELATALRRAWRQALLAPHLDILWRTSGSGDRLLPNGFVQELQRAGDPAGAVQSEPRVLRELSASPSVMPRPAGSRLPVQRLSASGYADLRRCPYRFFALRQLKLAEADELDNGLDKRDFGNWLHKVLFHFHEALVKAPALERQAQEAIIKVASERATAELGLSAGEFLPFAAAWPRVRTGYLDWLGTHLATGYHFVEGETWKDLPLGSVRLVGKLDRVDWLDGQSDGACLVIDYKTESSATTKERIKSGTEDTQLAFYAALMDVDNIRAAYVNVGEKDGTSTHLQPDIVEIRSQLAEGILDDMQRIADGHAMPAMGEGLACEFCAARGLCRKDFWK